MATHPTSWCCVVRAHAAVSLCGAPHGDACTATDGTLSVRHLETLRDGVSTLLVKGVTAFCVNESHGPVLRLCVASKRKLTLYNFMAGDYHATKELAVPDTPLALTWYGHSICAAYGRREYSLLNDETDDPTEMEALLDPRTQPLIKVVPNEELLLTSAEHIHSVTPQPPRRPCSASRTCCALHCPSPHMSAFSADLMARSRRIASSLGPAPRWL